MTALNPEALRLTLAHHQDPDERRRAAEELGLIRHPDAVNALVTAIRDANKGVRDAALRSLTMIGGTPTAHALISLLEDADLGIRNAAAQAIVRIGPASVPAVLPILEHGSPDTLKFALDILGAIGSMTAATRIVGLLRHADPNVRLAAVEALGTTGGSREIGALCETYSVHAEARTYVIDALRRIGDLRAGRFVQDQFLRESTSDRPDPLLSIALADALSALGPREALEPVLTYSRQAAEPHASIYLIAALGIAERHGTAVDLRRHEKAVLLRTLDHGKEAHKIIAAHGLLSFADPDVTPALLRALGTGEDISFYLFSVLPRREDLAAQIPGALQDRSPSGVREVVSLVGQVADGSPLVPPLGDENVRVFNAVAACWTDADDEVRQTIIEALPSLDCGLFLSILPGLMSEADTWLRLFALEVIDRLEHPNADATCAQFLADPEEAVREQAELVLRSRAGRRQANEQGRPA